MTGAAFSSVKADSVALGTAHVAEYAAAEFQCETANFRELNTHSLTAQSVSAGSITGVTSAGTGAVVSAGSVITQSATVASASFGTLTCNSTNFTNVTAASSTVPSVSAASAALTSLTGGVTATTASAASTTAGVLAVSSALSLFGATLVTEPPSVFGNDMSEVIAVLVKLGLLSTGIDPAAPFVFSTGPMAVASEVSEIRSVAVSGDTVAVGCPFVTDDGFQVGRVFVFTKTAGVWSQQGPALSPSDFTGRADSGIRFGSSVSIDGDTMVVGGPYDNNRRGAVWVFTRTGGVWSQQGLKLVTEGFSGVIDYGTSVSVRGDVLVAGGPFWAGPPTGGVIGIADIWTRTGSVWTLQQQVQPNDLVEEAHLGAVVKLSTSGDTFVVAANWADSSMGCAYVYKLVDGTWVQDSTKLVGSGSVGLPVYQGYDVGINGAGTVIAVGGGYDNSQAGAVWVFRRTGSGWVQDGSKITMAVPAGLFGWSVDLDDSGLSLVVGSNGHVTSLVDTGSGWVETGDYQDPETGNYFGAYIAITRDGSRFVTMDTDVTAGFVRAYVFDK